MKCKCGNERFLLEWGKLKCAECGARQYIRYSAEEHKIMKNEKHYFWAVLTPKFIEAMDRHFPDNTDEMIISICKDIEKSYKGKWPKVHCKTTASKFRGKHIYWRYKFNPHKRRAEVVMSNVTNSDRIQDRRKEDVKFITVDFK
tara:strand:+ start:29 stop:460 length:432 start_codon:yes stop_codon:yes gene_type:complete